MVKPEYIKEIEKTEGILSVMNFHVFRNEVFRFLDDKKLNKVYERSHVELDGNAIWDEIIYQTDPFFLHVENKSDDMPEWYITIYYKPEKFNEVIIFIRQSLKQLRYGKTDNE
jgi:hypothetical protein